MWKYQRNILFSFLSAAVCSILLCSCKILPEPVQTPQKVYDMGIPEKLALPAKINLYVLPFTNSSASHKKIVLRTGKNTITEDAFHVWAQSPAQMLTHYLRSVFQQSSTSSSDRTSSCWILSGDILVFEGNCTTQEAILSVQCKLTCGDTVIRLPITIAEPFPQDPGSPDSQKTAAAMQKAMFKLAGQIQSEFSRK